MRSVVVFSQLACAFGSRTPHLGKIASRVRKHTSKPASQRVPPVRNVGFGSPPRMKLEPFELSCPSFALFLTEGRPHDGCYGATDNGAGGGWVQPFAERPSGSETHGTEAIHRCPKTRGRCEGEIAYERGREARGCCLSPRSGKAVVVAQAARLSPVLLERAIVFGHSVHLPN